MASEILGLASTLDAGSWSNPYTNVEKLATADDDTTFMTCVRMSVPSTCKFSLEDTALTTILKVVIRGRLRYETGNGQATLYVKDSGGSTIVSCVCAVGATYSDFAAEATGSWSDTDVNAWEYWCTFDSGDTPGTNDIRITSAEIEVYDTLPGAAAAVPFLF